MVPAAVHMRCSRCAVVARSGCGRRWGRRRSQPGLAAFAAYALVLAALERASAASVAAVRETSVVIAAALAAPILGERVGPVRLAGAVLVVLGIAFIGLD